MGEQDGVDTNLVGDHEELLAEEVAQEIIEMEEETDDEVCAEAGTVEMEWDKGDGEALESRAGSKAQCSMAIDAVRLTEESVEDRVDLGAAEQGNDLGNLVKERSLVGEAVLEIIGDGQLEKRKPDDVDTDFNEATWEAVAEEAAESKKGMEKETEEETCDGDEDEDNVIFDDRIENQIC